LPVPEVSLRDRGAAPLALVNLGAFVLLYIFYVSVEVGVTSWETEYLNPHFGASAAAYTSLYWLAITVGRVLAAPLSARLRSHSSSSTPAPPRSSSWWLRTASSLRRWRSSSSGLASHPSSRQPSLG